MSHVLRAARHPRHGMSGCGRHLRASRCRAVGYDRGPAAPRQQSGQRQGGHGACGGLGLDFHANNPSRTHTAGIGFPHGRPVRARRRLPPRGERPSGRPARELARSGGTAISRAQVTIATVVACRGSPRREPAPTTIQAVGGLVGRRSFRGRRRRPRCTTLDRSAGPVSIGTVPSHGCASSRMPKRPVPPSPGQERRLRSVLASAERRFRFVAAGTRRRPPVPPTLDPAYRRRLTTPRNFPRSRHAPVDQRAHRTRTGWKAKRAACAPSLASPRREPGSRTGRCCRGRSRRRTLRRATRRRPGSAGGR